MCMWEYVHEGVGICACVNMCECVCACVHMYVWTEKGSVFPAWTVSGGRLRQHEEVSHGIAQQ